MSRHSEQAAELFREGYNCAQSVFVAFCDETGMDRQTALKLSSSFGGGMGRLREVCGALTGAFMVAGIKYGYTGSEDDEVKKRHYELIQEIAEKFKEKNSTIICRELLDLSEEKIIPTPDKRTKQYYDTRPCERLVYEAAEIMDEIIQKRSKGNMLIAVASNEGKVTEHFGHCESFNLFEVERGEIVGKKSVPNPGHRPGFLPNFLNDLGVKVIISGGMGGGAVDIFNQHNIEVIVGASGNAEDCVKAYNQGLLKSTGTVCHSHEHADECH